MKRAIAAVAVAVLANGAVLFSVGRERGAPATHTTVQVCPDHLIGGGDSDGAPALRLVLAPDSLSTPAGLDPAGLRALGYTDTLIAAVGREADSTFRSPRARPAWVRLLQRSDSAAEWSVAEVVPLSERLARDSGSIVIRGLVSVHERWNQPPAAPTGSHDHAATGATRRRGVIYAAVHEVLPHQLHLDRRQIAALRAANSDTMGCAVQQHVVIASGVNGGIWVETARR